MIRPARMLGVSCKLYVDDYGRWVDFWPYPSETLRYIMIYGMTDDGEIEQEQRILDCWYLSVL